MTKFRVWCGAIALGAIVAACGDGPNGPTTGFDPASEPFGAIVPTAEEFARAAKALPREALRAPEEGLAATTQDLPSGVVLLNVPTSQAQGTAQKKGWPGSCEVWSAGYAMGSYAANVVNQQPLTDLANTVSAAYVYADVLNVENKSCGSGTSATDTLDYLVQVGDEQQGAPSLATIRYEPDCHYLSGIELGQTFDTDLSIGSYSRYGGTSALETIKSTIAGGLMAQMSLQLPYNFPEYDGGLFAPSTTCPTPAPGQRACAMAKSGSFACLADTSLPSGCAQHGVAFVGYDDEQQALLILNSFGTDWGEDGLMWMSYDTFAEVFLGGTIAEAPPAPTDAAPSVSGHQWRETRIGEPDGVHLVLPTVLERPVRLEQVTLVAPGSPDSDALAQDYGQWFRAGPLYLTRRDGRQFPAGAWEVELRGTHVDGTPFTLRESVDVGALPGSDLAAAPPTGAETGTNGQPVVLSPDAG